MSIAESTMSYASYRAQVRRAASDEAPQDLHRRAARLSGRLLDAAATPPCLVFLGESNSGKTTAANALLGDGLLPTAVISNTRYPTLVKYSANVSATAVTVSGGLYDLASGAARPSDAVALIEIGLPNPVLKQFEILDTPGSFDGDELLTLPVVPPLRIPVWCTVATQAWKESERRTWLGLEPQVRRLAILAVTGLDRIADPELEARVFARLKAEALPFFTAGASALLDSQRLREKAWPLLQDVVRQRAADVAARRRRTIERLRSRLLRLAALPDEPSPPPPGSDSGPGQAKP